MEAELDEEGELTCFTIGIYEMAVLIGCLMYMWYVVEQEGWKR